MCVWGGSGQFHGGSERTFVSINLQPEGRRKKTKNNNKKNTPPLSLLEPVAMPGFDYKFLEKPKRRFQCPLCSKAMREPVQVSTCGHRFCDTCLQEFLR